MKMSSGIKTNRKMLGIILIVNFIFSIQSHVLFSIHHLGIHPGPSSVNLYSSVDSQSAHNKILSNNLSHIFPEDFELSKSVPLISNTLTGFSTSLPTHCSLFHYFREIFNSKTENQKIIPRAPPFLDPCV